MRPYSSRGSITGAVEDLLCGRATAGGVAVNLIFPFAGRGADAFGLAVKTSVGATGVKPPRGVGWKMGRASTF